MSCTVRWNAVILHSRLLSRLRLYAEDVRVAATSSQISTSSPTTLFSRVQCSLTFSSYAASPSAYCNSQHSNRLRSTASGTERNSWMWVGLQLNTEVGKIV